MADSNRRQGKLTWVKTKNIAKMNQKTLQNFPAGGGYKNMFTSGGNF